MKSNLKPILIIVIVIIALLFFKQRAKTADATGSLDSAAAYAAYLQSEPLIGSSNPEEFKKGVKLLYESAYSGCLDAQLSLGAILARDTVASTRQGSFETAVELFTMAANQHDNAIAMLNLCRLFVAAGDTAKGVEWAKKSAGKGDYVAQFMLGEMLLDKNFGPVDTAAAMEWLEKSALQNYPDAETLLQTLYSDTVQLLKEAAKGNGKAQIRLAKYYMRHAGESEEAGKEAVRWVTESMKSNTPEAFYYMASMVEQGMYGLKQDPQEVFKLHKKGAELQEPHCQYLLSFYYFNGDLVAKDSVEATRLLTLSAAAGLPNATGALEILKAGGVVK